MRAFSHLSCEKHAEVNYGTHRKRWCPRPIEALSAATSGALCATQQCRRRAGTRRRAVLTLSRGGAACSFMRGGGCGEVFKAWEACVDKHREDVEGFAVQCSGATQILQVRQHTCALWCAASGLRTLGEALRTRSDRVTCIRGCLVQSWSAASALVCWPLLTPALDVVRSCPSTRQGV